MNFTNIKRIFARGLALAIPLGVVAYVFIKLVGILEKLVTPLAAKLGIEKILGELTLTILAILVLLLLMFLLGLLMQLSFIAVFGKSLEDTVIKFIPSLNNFKDMMAEKLRLEDLSGNWKPVLMFHDDNYQPGFIIEESEDLITVYIVKGTTLNDGEILITRKDKLSFTDITASQIHSFSKQFGKGYLSLIKKSNS
jgi:hypothetical protein